jgi:hypothetical protein
VAARLRARLSEAFEGAALGLVGGPAAGFGAAYSGIGDVRLHTWVFVLILGGIIGTAAWPIFADASGPPGRRGVGFAALFAGACGLLAGTIAAFPVGAISGSLGGALGGAVAAAVWRLAPRLGGWTTAISAVVGAGVALAAVAAWLR